QNISQAVCACVVASIADDDQHYLVPAAGLRSLLCLDHRIVSAVLPPAGTFRIADSSSSRRLVNRIASGRHRVTFSLKLSTNTWSSWLLDSNVRAATITSVSFRRMLPPLY